MIEMKAGIFASPAVTYPLSVVMNMRVFGVIIMIATVPLVRRAVEFCRTAARNVSAAKIMMLATIVIATVMVDMIVLRETAQRNSQACDEQGNSS